jgi:glycerate kinase
LAAISEAGGLTDTLVVCLCDVVTRWEQASRIFGPQKGADDATVAKLEERLARMAADLPRDPRGLPGGGAGGGLAGGLWASLDAELRPGAAYVCDALDVDGRIARADLVLGGEGRLDETSLEGKILGELAGRCARAGKPLAAIVGDGASDRRVSEALGLSVVVEASDAEAICRAARDLAESHPV